MSPPITLIGNPANRRVTMFQAALAAQDRLPAHVVAWRDLVEPGAPARLLGDVRGIVRIDSPGEDDEIERALIRRGEGAARARGFRAIDARGLAAIPYEVGRILHPRQHHLGLSTVLDEIANAAPAGVRWLQPPGAIALLFDKAACSARWRARGVPMPETLDGVVDPDDLRARMEAAAWRSVYVKVTSSSSAALLAVFTHARGREQAMTTVEDTGHARYNTRKIQRVVERGRIDRLLEFLLGEGAIVERAIPKARLDGRYCDLRVLAIDGEPAFVVLRTSPHPITNLHLGGTRGDVGAFCARMEDDAWARAMASCVAVQRDSGAFHVGVDVMFEPDLAHHRVIEGNAFGDLLPNLARDGLDVYGWQIRRMLEREHADPPVGSHSK